MFSIIFWIGFVLIIIFAIVERSIKSTISDEAKIIFARQHEKIIPSTLRQLLNDPISLKIHDGALGEFQKFFVCNSGIFLLPLHPGLATFAVLHSLCTTIAFLAIIMCFFLTTTLQSVLYLALFIYFFYISSPAWYPVAGRDDANLERASANYNRTFNKNRREVIKRNQKLYGNQEGDQHIYNMCQTIIDYEMKERYSKFMG